MDNRARTVNFEKPKSEGDFKDKLMGYVNLENLKYHSSTSKTYREVLDEIWEKLGDFEYNLFTDLKDLDLGENSLTAIHKIYKPINDLYDFLRNNKIEIES